MKIEVENTQQNEQVDWTKNPQLVVSDAGTIVLYLYSNNNTTFEGIETRNNISLTDGWVKNSFKPFHGKITLSND
jgi:hypothetical protein